MKQKVLFKVPMHDEKSRAKAMRITATLPGVHSLALKGDDKKQIEVMGEDMDMIRLITSLRKKIGYAELVSVSKVEPPKPDGNKKSDGDKKPDEDEKPEGDKKQELPCVCSWPQGYCYGVHYNQSQVWIREPDYDQEPNCTTM